MARPRRKLTCKVFTLVFAADLMVNVMHRGVQDDPAACWRTLLWQDRQTRDRPCNRPDARRAEPQESDL